MRRVLNWFLLTLSAVMLPCCNSPRVLQTGVQKAGFHEGGSMSRVIDTVLFHDTVRITERYIGDTVFVDRQRIRYVERYQTRTDTVTAFRCDTITIILTPEPNARSKPEVRSGEGFMSRLSGLLQIAGVIFIILSIIKIRLH